MMETIMYGKKNMLTRVCQYVISKVKVQDGYILLNCSKGITKDLRKQGMLS